LEKIDDFFEKGKNEFRRVDSVKEKRVVKKYNRILDRNINIQESIVNSAETILNEIQNWDKEKDLVAKSLLRISNWILKSEKDND
jgi:hypothetical protein